MYGDGDCWSGTFFVCVWSLELSVAISESDTSVVQGVKQAAAAERSGAEIYNVTQHVMRGKILCKGWNGRMSEVGFRWRMFWIRMLDMRVIQRTRSL